MLSFQRTCDHGIRWRLDGFSAALYSVQGDPAAEDLVSWVDSGVRFKIENLWTQVGGSLMRIEFRHEDSSLLVVLFRCEW